MKGDLATAERLVRSSVDPNVADENRQVPLHFAVAFGHTKIVALLLERGADVNIANKNGVTALLAAAQRGQVMREDETRAMDVYRALQQAEFTPWIDRSSLIPGAPWAEEFKEAL